MTTAEFKAVVTAEAHMLYILEAVVTAEAHQAVDLQLKLRKIYKLHNVTLAVATAYITIKLNANLITQ